MEKARGKIVRSAKLIARPDVQNLTTSAPRNGQARTAILS
jgi:hypothetical protein